MAQLSKCFLTGDFTEWPLDQATACEICRVRFVRGPEAVVDKYAELKIRSQVVKDMANIYIERHVHDLGNRSHVLKLHPAAKSGNLREQFRVHIEKRVDELYPPGEFGGTDGAVLPQIRRLADGFCPERSKEVSASEMKQSTMPDTPNTGAHLFHGVRPTIVVDEAATAGTFSQETLLQATAPKIAGLDVKMSNDFQDLAFSLGL